MLFGALDKGAVEELLAESEEVFRECWTGGRRAPVLELRVRIDNHGQVIYAHASSERRAPDSLKDCVEKEAERWGFELAHAAAGAIVLVQLDYGKP